MNKLADAGIVIGHTVTPSMIEQAKAAGLPDAAMIELWPKRTINKAALAAIEAAVKESKKKAITKEGEA